MKIADLWPYDVWEVFQTVRILHFFLFNVKRDTVVFILTVFEAGTFQFNKAIINVSLLRVYFIMTSKVMKNPKHPAQNVIGKLYFFIPIRRDRKIR